MESADHYYYHKKISLIQKYQDTLQYYRIIGYGIEKIIPRRKFQISPDFSRMSMTFFLQIQPITCYFFEKDCEIVCLSFFSYGVTEMKPKILLNTMVVHF